MAQRAFEPIRPAVVRADDARLRLSRRARIDETHAAMAADVEEGAKAPGGVARQQHRHAVFVVGEHVAGRQLAGMADDERQPAEQPLDLGVANARAEVVLDRDARGGLAAVLPLEPAGNHLGADAAELRGGVRRQCHGDARRMRASFSASARHCASTPRTIVDNEGEDMDARRFEGKVALVTGGNSGIGLAVAKGLVDEGARVVIVGRNAETVARSAGELGASARGVVADTARLADLDRVIAATREFGGGRLDVVFANAGVGTFGPLAATTEAMWDSMVDINVKGVYFTVQKAVALMGRGGAIVLNASVAAGKGNVGSSVYAATKAAVRSFGRTIANELIEQGIRVNVVSPGPIETPIFDRAANPEQVAAIKAAMIARNPMKRFGTTDEVTAAVLFLASDAASYITGVDLLIDGGVGSF
jgi:NAD(P)-dependent dehydrogenase (short-subunit alcohol dehydrogenase family)